MRLAVIGVAFVVALVVPAFVSNAYVLDLIVLLWIYAVLAYSLNLALGYAGLFTFAFTGFMGLGAYTTGLLTVDLGWPPAVGLVAAVAAPSALAFAGGFPALRLRGPYFVLFTIALFGVVNGLSTSLYGLTGGSGGLQNIPHLAVGGMSLESANSFYYVALFFLILAITLTYAIVHSHVGRGLIAVRDNEDLANSIGINPFKYRMTAFVLSAAMGGVAGWLYAHYVGVVDPNVFGFTPLFNVLFMVMLGGQGSLVGPLLGAFVVTFVPEFLRAAQTLRMAGFAVFLLVVVVFMPNGIWGFLTDRWHSYSVRRAGGRSLEVPGDATLLAGASDLQSVEL